MRQVATIIFLGCLLFLSALKLPAYAHEAIPTASNPLGWTYDYSCCSLKDCWQSKDEDVKVTKDGYFIEATKETFKYGDYPIKRSKDEFYHRCSIAGDPTARTICLYVPDRGF